VSFSAATIGRLEYDFRSFTKDGSDTERCTGKGFIPEPSKAALKEFFAGIAGLGDAFQTGPVTDDAVEEAAASLEDRIYAVLSNVCSGTPSIDELKQLPPRILAAFCRYLTENLAPKA
jgi:hypothetical protein